MYKPTIGLEVHAELKTKSKMFCGCENNPHAAEANTLICPICLAHPGTLPVANEEAVKQVVMFATAVKGDIADYSEFDRKHYFYPDIPKAYQISQYAFPFVSGGELNGVKLTRVHLEEDTARSQHDKGDYSLVDFNRAGVPLMELVTEPVITSAEEAGAFAKELQLLLRTLGISTANMEKGEMRVEANISVSQTDEFGTKVEVKNLNSFKAVESAIKYEIERHINVLEKGGVIQQETRGWDETKGKTFSQRSKETAKDYRYFPDPDLPKLKLSEVSLFSAENISKSLPLLPAEKRLKYEYLGLTSSQIETIIKSETLDKYFTTLHELAKDDAKVLALSANYLITDLAPLIGTELDPNTSILTPQHFLALVRLAADKKITSRVAKDLLIEFSLNDTDLTKIISERGLSSEISGADLESLVAQIMADNPNVVAEFKAGKTTALQYLIGQAMKATKGTANPATLTELFNDLLL